MKKNIISIALAVAALVSVACQKEEGKAPAPVQQQKLCAYESVTKSTINPDWTVGWNQYDMLTVFNAAAGTTTYSDNCRFVIEGDPAEGIFSKDEAQPEKALIDGAESYDWYVCSPWMEFGAKPGATKGYTVPVTPTQNGGYNTTMHVSAYDLMAGKELGVAAGAIPSIPLHHVCTVMKFTITNNSGEPTPITGMKLDATAGGTYITGSFTMDWSGDTPRLDPSKMGSQKSYTSTLTVADKDPEVEGEAATFHTTDINVGVGESVDLYMVVAPFTIPAGKTIKMTIYGGLGEAEVSKTMTADITFAAGRYNTANLSYTKPEKAIFTETFGAKAYATANVGTYDKAGLTTLVPGDKEAYTYVVGGNASIAIPGSDIDTANYGEYLDGAVIKLPCISSASFISIKSIAVSSSTGYIFRYNKAAGADAAQTTVFKWRKTGTTAWASVNQTQATGIIEQEFTTGADCTMIDIMIQGSQIGSTQAKYTAVDLLKLIEK